jgi:hypothetical protein
MKMWTTGTKERTEEPETRTIKTFSSTQIFRQQETTYRTELWSVKHIPRYCCMWKARKSSIYHRRETVADVNTLRTGSFKMFKHPFPGFLKILTL